MTADTSLELGLFAEQTEAKYGDSGTVATIRALIKEIEDQGKMDTRRRVYCSQALKYAAIMDQQTKSAVAAVQAGVQLTELIEKYLTDKESEAGQLAQLIEALEGDPFA